MGFTVSQVVHDYGDICQVITELAVEQNAPITTEEFNVLNRCLDIAIADAVTEHVGGGDSIPNADRTLEVAMAKQSTTDQFSRLYEHSRPVFDEVADRTKHMYEDAREWVPEHRGTVAAVSAVAAGACLLGYLVGRSGRKPRSAPEQTASTATGTSSHVADLDIRPVFRLVSLWMLYRVATRD